MPQLKFARTSTLTLSLAVATAMAYGAETGLDLTITLKSNDQATKTIANVAHYGTILSKSDDSTRITVRLDNPLEVASVVSTIQKYQDVSNIDVIQPTLPNQDLTALPFSELKQLVDDYKVSYDAWAVFNGQEREENSKYPALGYLKAYLQYLEIRAYPNDEIDYSGHIDVAKRRIAERQSASNGRESANPAARGTITHLGNFGGGGGGGGNPSTDGEWEFMGPTDLDVPYRTYYGIRPTSGRVNAIAFTPGNSDVRYLGGAQGGVWKTEDAGTNWEPLTDDWPLLSVSSIAVNPNNPNHVLVGTGDFHGGNKPGIGIFRSTDGGDTWTPLGQNLGSQSVSEVHFYPGVNDLAFASTGPSGGRVYKSEDGGLTWEISLNQNARWSDLDIGVEDGGGNRDMWAVGYGTDNVYVSSDQGDNWTQVDIGLLSNGQGAISVACSKIDPDTVYIMSSSDRRIIKSTDAGANWTDITSGFVDGGGYNWSQAWYDYHLYTSVATNGNATRELVFTGLIDVVMSDDGGQNWFSVGGLGGSTTYSNNAILHNDQHSFAINPDNPMNFMSGNDGGVYNGVYDWNNRTVNWTPLSRNLGITQFYTFAMFPGMSDYVMGGTQDNASPHSHGNLSAWLNETGGDGAGCAINYNNYLIQYGSSQFHGLSRTNNAWQSSFSIRPNFSGHSVPFIGDMWMDTNDPRWVYINTNYLCRYDADNNSWEFLGRNGGPLTNGRVNAVAFGKDDSNLIYVGTTNGDLFMTEDFGATFVDISGGLPNRAVTHISVSPDNNYDILVSLSGSNSDKVYNTTDTQAGTVTWVSRSGVGQGALPDVSVNAIARDPSDPVNAWFLGTDVGVYFTSDGGASYEDWTYTKGLPNVQVNKIYTDETTGIVYAATYGRGIWRLNLDTSIVDDIIASPAEVIEKQSTVVEVTLKQPSNGLTTLMVSSSDPDVLAVPQSVVVRLGQDSVVFVAEAGEVDEDTPVTITITDPEDNNASVDLTVLNAYSAYPSRSVVSNAVNISGTAKNLQESDDVYFAWDQFNPRFETSARFSGQLKAPEIDDLIVNMEIGSSSPSVSYRLYLYDFQSNGLVLVGSGLARTEDEKLEFRLNGGASKFLDSRGQFHCVVRMEGSKFGSRFTTRIDQLVLNFR